MRSRKVRYIGCSTHPAWMVMEALMISERLGIARYVSSSRPTICSIGASRTSLSSGAKIRYGAASLVAVGRRNLGGPLQRL